MDIVSPKNTAKERERDLEPDENIGAILEQLDGEHLVLHGVEIRSGNIDHLVLSREHGVFLIETKAHAGWVSVVDTKLRLNGKLPDKDFVAPLLMNTYWLSEEIRTLTGLDPLIRPLIAFTNASVSMGRPLKGIPIADRKSLLSTIQSEGEPIQAELWNAREKIATHFAKPISGS